MQETNKTETSGLSVTIFIPAYNEEMNLAAAVEGAKNALRGRVTRQEIIILNACSQDRTGEIADKIAADDSTVKVIHRREWFGLGANFMAAVQQASMDYFVLFPGDNENSWESLAETLSMAGQTDIIIPYTINTEVRAWHRRFISKSFVNMLNLLFNLRLRYYTGNAVYRRDQLQKLDVKSHDFAYNAEILIKLVKSGHTYREFGIKIKPTGKTVIFRPKNLLGIARTVVRLFFDVMIKNRSRYRLAPVARGLAK